LKVVEHRKPDTADDNQRAHRHIEQEVAAVTHHVVGEQGKTGIAERRDRMKDPHVNGLVQGQLGAPMNSQKNGSNDFRPEREQGDAFDKTQDILARGMGEQVLHDHPLTEGNALADPSEQSYRYCHDTQTADLDKQQDHALAERGETTPSIHNRKTRDAHRGRYRKQCVHPSDRIGLRGYREFQHERPHGYGQEEARQDEDRGMRFEESAANRHYSNLGFRQYSR